MSDLATKSRSANLQKAQRVRLSRAAYRGHIKAQHRHRGEAAVAELIAAPPAWLRAAPLLQVLTWPRGRGPAWARAVLRRAGLEDAVTVGELTEDEVFRVLPNMVCGSAVWTPERMVAFALFLAREWGRTPTRVEFERLSRSRRGARLRHFGTWRALCEAAGLRPVEVIRTQGGIAVPTSALREIFERSGMTAQEVALRAGWLRPYTRDPSRSYPDGSRVRRALGLRKSEPGHGYAPSYRRHVGEPVAVALLAAMGVDPVEVGL